MGIMETIYLDDFLKDGILKEKHFRNLVNEKKWEQFRDKYVLIKGCASAPIPTWAYLIITAELSQFAKQIMYGELGSTIKVFRRKNI